MKTLTKSERAREAETKWKESVTRWWVAETREEIDEAEAGIRETWSLLRVAEVK